MNGYFVASIVEGHGEVQAVPILLRRIFAEIHPAAYLPMNNPIRVKASRFLRDDAELFKYVTLAALQAKRHSNGVVLILLDCEDGCPAQVGPALLARARTIRDDVPILVALAHREYETWFMAAARSLRGTQGLPPTMDAPSDPERTRDAKGWMSRQLGVTYNEPNHQPALTRCFDFQEAASVPSFARLYRKLRVLFTPAME